MTSSSSHPTTSSAPHHPGTSGRSPPPSRSGAASAAGGGGGGATAGGGGRSSIGSSSNAGVVVAPSIGGSSRSSSGRGSAAVVGSAHRWGTRLSYGVVAPASEGGGGATPAHRGMSPPSTSSTANDDGNDDDDDDDDDGGRRRSDFLAALSPATARFLAGRGFGAGGRGEVPAAAAVDVRPSSAASWAAAAADASRGTAPHAGSDADVGDDVDGAVGGDDDGEEAGVPATPTTNGDEREAAQLRKFVRSLLGMHPSPSTDSSPPHHPFCATTPDPATAAFFAVALLAKTNGPPARSGGDDDDDDHGGCGVIGGGQRACRWRPDDAYLAARALSLNGEHKRAIYVLDKVGLIGLGVGEEIDGGGGGGGGDGPGDVAGGGGVVAGGSGAAGGGGAASPSSSSPPDGKYDNAGGVRNALLLRAESALLAGQCMAGEYERALTVYEEAMRFPPPPPPAEWGRYGYGYRRTYRRRRRDDDVDIVADDGGGGQEEGGGGEEEEEEDDDEMTMNDRLADEAYVRAWREQSLSHTALIDDGDDERLVLLAANVQPLPFSSDDRGRGAASMATAMGGIHPVARLCAARGIAYDAVSNPHRAVPFLRAAMTIDPRCVEALDYAVRRRLLTPEEEREWVSGLNFGDDGTGEDLSDMGISWLRDAYLARLRGIGGVGGPNSTSAAPRGRSGDDAATDIMSPVPRSDLQSPSMLSLSSPDFAGGAVVGGRDGSQPPVGPFAPSEENKAAAEAYGNSLTIDGAFRNLAIRHNLGRSPDVLSHAAIRSYALHDLHSALAYCAAIDSIDPYCRTAGYVHVATLVGLNLKRRLFQLAHRLVDTDPKDSLAWFAVGSYYYACRRYDLAQRHFSRSTRLDPSSAECWIGFGCSFAVCDESDQALASFRAAQNKYSGSHIALLYMGMEYLRTNHLSLAGHFLNSAQKTDPCDMLCCNELGVWCYRQGNLVDAAFWFMKALRLHARAESSVLTSSDEGLGMNGYILLTGRSAEGGERTDTAVVTDYASTPNFQRRSSGVGPPVSTVLCAVKTPSGQLIAPSFFGDNVNVDNDGLTDMDCVERCMDQFWEPAIFNLGQSYRKMNRYGDAIVCFEKCSSLNPVSCQLLHQQGRPSDCDRFNADFGYFCLNLTLTAFCYLSHICCCRHS